MRPLLPRSIPPVRTSAGRYISKLLHFKQKKQPDFSGWIDYARHKISLLNWPKSGLVVRALHCYESAGQLFGHNPLDYLGHALAK